MLLALALQLPATAQIATYTGSGGTSVAVVGVPNETVSTLQKTGFGTNTPCSSGGLSGMTVSTAYTSYSSTGPHVYFQITPNAGYLLNVTGFSVVTRESGTGPTRARLAYSLDGGASWVAESSDHTQTVGASCGTYSNTFSWAGGLSVGCITSTTNGIIVAIYPYAPGSSSGTFQVNSMTVSGSVTAVCSPSAISGSTTVCEGNTTTLSHGTSGGTWTSSNTAVATIGSTTGIATGVAAGTSIITYRISACCIATTTLTVNQQPAAITGTTTLCEGAATTLSDATAGGTWSSSSTGIATVGSTTGIVSGISAGTSMITYRLSTGCFVTTSVLVNPLPSAISGTTTLCEGYTSTLSSSGSGLWASSNTAVAIVGSVSGLLSGISAGTAVITYTLGTGCLTTTTVLINPLPAAITGVTAVCVGNTTLLSDATTGGTWSSSNTAVAVVGSLSGIVAGLSAGTSIITYQLSTGCFVATTVLVNPLPTAIAGTTTLCEGYTTTLSSSGSGLWASSNTAVATVGSVSGVLSGISAGTAVITYTLGTGCLTTTTVLINPLPAAITGGTAVCVGNTTLLSDATAGGIWTSSNTAVATIGSLSGIVAGLSAGTTIITYQLSTGCFVTTLVLVNPLPAPITGITSVCIGSTTALFSTGGGIWSSSNTAVATVGSLSGILSGISAGTAVITYTLGTGCLTTTIITVNPLPAAITGVTAVCVGNTTTLSDATIGGTWSSSNIAVATIGSLSGVASGVSAGTAIITYTLSTGCIATTTLLVNPLPAPITGITSVCVGSTTTLFSAGVGVWTSSNTAVATVGSISGILSGISAGTVVITYTLGTGCLTTTIITVNPLPAAITGVTAVCVGNTTTLSDATIGGTWSSSNIAIATIGSLSGVVSGISSGTAIITYTLSTGCIAFTTVFVNSLPTPITGVATVCEGSVTTLFSPGGGLWSSSDLAVATVGSISGIVSGIIAGAAIITYSLGTGCYTIATVTVDPLPAPITGTTDVCEGLNTLLADATPGGLWSSDDMSIATVGSLSGIVSGVSPGTVTITYTLTTGCSADITVTVNPLPNPITGVTAICLGATSALTDAGGGTWTSSNILVAPIGMTTGIVTGVGVGSAIITYTLPTGCFITTVVTINPLPAPIAGVGRVCEGLTTLFSSITPGGSWSSGNIVIAVVGTLSGIVTGVNVGTAVITYTLSTGCIATKIVTVNPLPNPITGITAICLGNTSLLSNAGGGAWSSSAPGVAPVGIFTGIVTGAAVGTAVITYTLPTNCLITTTVTVNPLPAAITGTTSVCPGLTTTLSNTTPGGLWTSGATGIATIGSLSGIVAGVSSGTAIITYTLSTGCRAVATVTVLPLPPAISGPSAVCIGATIALSNATPGGTWQSSNTAIATVGSVSGIVSGIALGTTVITYRAPSGCFITTTVSVNLSPAAITGPATVCVGATVLLNNTILGGSWTSSAPAVATVGFATGVVTGIAPGTTVITYSLGLGCVAYRTMTVIPSPAPIAGRLSFCAGATSLLTSGTSGGSWASGNTAVAGIGSASGLATGITAGTAVITYSLLSGCMATAVATVQPLPPAITGVTALCVGSVGLLSNALAGGSWSSGATAIATIGSATGLLTGVAPGTAAITYTSAAGCSAYRVETINPLPAAITGMAAACVGFTTTLSSVTSGGLWVSGDIAVATVGSLSGIVAGVSAGAAQITYTLTTGCFAVRTVTINATPSAIAGTRVLCAGATEVFTTTPGGGLWSSSALAVAVIGSLSGSLTAVSAGTAVITYSLGGGCVAVTAVTVNAVPAAIAGAANVCVGSAITLTDATPGGVWVSADITVATVGSMSGVVAGIAAGTTTISYVLTTGCFAVKTITVNAQPSAISGATELCVGHTTTLATATPGGSWTSGNTLIATTGSATSIVTGVAPGTAIITYSLPTGCWITTSVLVRPVPTAITGPASVCVGSTITLSDAIPGGVWSSANTGVATIGSTTGILTGISSGTVLVDYTLGSGCMAMTTIIVNPVSPINGPNTVCQGQAITLSDTTEGGVWSSSAPGIATVVRTGDTTAIVRGLTTGVATITYFLPTGCVAYKIVRVLPAPPAITGPSQVCEGSTITLSDPVFGGTWTSGSAGIATVGLTTGVVYGVAPGVATISYTVGSCPATRDITVNPLPAPIAGSFNVCVGSTNILTDATPGGTWLSSRPAIATIGVGTGALTGVATGTATISYVLITTGCAATQVVNVDPVPLPITGSSNVCIGLTSALADATPFGGWSSSAPGTAYVDAFGLVTGISLGTATITYTIGTGCFVTRMVTVNSLPPAITGATNVCQGQSVTFSDATPGGSWLSGDVTIATAGSSTGIVTGLAPGTAPITYTLGTGCIAVKDIIVDPLPSPIVGTPQVCEGQTTMLYSGPPGGGWSSSTTPVATVDAGSGLVTGVRAGTATITYSNGCYTTITVTVNIMPAAITGNTNICLGSTSALRNTVSGGSWSSSATAIAPVGLSGIVTGAALGTATITYAMGAGCLVTTSVKVLPLPNVFTVGGGGSFCASGTGVHITLSGSEVGVNYLLYIGSTPTGTFAGTGSALDFGLQTVGGLYRVVAISSITGCSSNMAGTATIVVNPTLIPSVNITAGPSDTICAGASTTFTAAPTNGGTAPTYVWTVNGVTVGAGATYTFIPADGDVIRTILTSNALCALPDTASYSKRITVSANQTPVVNIVSAPGDTVCKGMAITLTANAVYGGSSPAIVWRKFGLNVSAGPTYAYIPNDGDVVTCFITSNYPCLLTDTATSLGLQISVDTPLLPHVLITASPSTHVGTGKTVTLTANVEDAGLHPTYQWLKNGVPIPGATNSIYSSNTFATGYQDSVTCVVTSSGVCPVSSFGWVYILVSDVSVGGVGATGGNLQILPNPNNGTFILKGTTGDNTTEELQLDITNMLGQTVHRQTLQSKAGKVNEQITITGQLANGMYIITLKSNNGMNVFHMVVEQ